MGALGDGRVKLPAQAVVEREGGGNLPGILRVDIEVVAADGGWADVRAVGKVRRRNGNGVREGTAGKKAGKRVRERIAGTDVMCATLRGDEFSGVGGSSSKVVFAVGADAEVGCVAIDADLEAGFESVAGGGEGHVLAALEEVAVCLHDGAGGGVEGFKEAVVELDRGVGRVGGGKAWRGTRDADG